MEEAKVSEYEIKIDFKKNSENPSRIFKSMAQLVDAFQEMDVVLINSISKQTSTNIFLEDVYVSSLKAKLITILSIPPRDAIQVLDWRRVVGSYIDYGRELIIKQAESKDTINNVNEVVKEVVDPISEKAHELGLDRNLDYESLKAPDVLNILEQTSSSIKPLSDEDGAKYLRGGSAINLNKGFHLPKKQVEQMLNEQMNPQEYEQTIIIKKADLLGSSKWDFISRTGPFSARICDEKWLNAFHGRKMALKPGDSLRSIMRTTTTKNRQTAELSFEYEIIKVLKIIPYEEDGQTYFKF